eukprot:3993552-Alexandrium_andersonii.AAC.1
MRSAGSSSAVRSWAMIGPIRPRPGTSCRSSPGRLSVPRFRASRLEEDPHDEGPLLDRPPRQ